MFKSVLYVAFIVCLFSFLGRISSSTNKTETKIVNRNKDMRDVLLFLLLLLILLRATRKLILLLLLQLAPASAILSFTSSNSIEFIAFLRFLLQFTTNGSIYAFAISYTRNNLTMEGAGNHGK